jgi:hypothetical protein
MNRLTSGTMQPIELANASESAVCWVDGSDIIASFTKFVDYITNDLSGNLTGLSFSFKSAKSQPVMRTLYLQNRIVKQLRIVRKTELHSLPIQRPGWRKYQGR